MGRKASRPHAAASVSKNECTLFFFSPLQEAGLKEGDYIISVNGKDCKWSKHAEVVQLLKSTGEEGVEIGVITLQGSEGPRAVSHVPSLCFGGENCSSGGRDGLLKPGSASSPKQVHLQLA